MTPLLTISTCCFSFQVPSSPLDLISLFKWAPLILKAGTCYEVLLILRSGTVFFGALGVVVCELLVLELVKFHILKKASFSKFGY